METLGRVQGSGLRFLFAKGPFSEGSALYYKACRPRFRV